MKPNDVFDELQNCQNDVLIFRKLINIAPLHNSSTISEIIKSEKEWKLILMHIVEITSSNYELGNERVLLACHAFYVLLSTRCTSWLLRGIIKRFQELHSSDLCFLERRYTVADLELFKLLNAYGYLQTNRKNMYKNSEDVLLLIFDILYRNCLKYTKYTYFAYKVLQLWLRRTSDNPQFWHENDIILEQKLEAVIFSNWSNALNDISKQNAHIFNIYLRIMSEKYNGFLEYVFEECSENMSWQNETKYIMLAEVYQLWNDIRAITEKNILLGLCTSLTKNSLRCSGTKLYLVILRKLSDVEWKETFGEVMKFIINRWESEENEDYNALQSLFKYWLEPTIEIHKNILEFLWKLCSNSQGYFSHSHLQRIAARLHVELPQTHEISCYINDKKEIVRLNAFAVLCHHTIVDLININEEDPFFQIKQFLWFNANAATIFMREGIIKYFGILCSNILKTISIKSDYVQSISEFTEWLYEYFLDCFEIGSCYQRKILALNLYKTLLSFTNGNLHENCARHRECLRNARTIDTYLKTADNWKFTNKKSLFILFRLVLDSALDVRQLATTLIVEYFEQTALSHAEKHVLYTCALEHCNSSKFYEIESGASLMKIIAYWMPLNEICKSTTHFAHSSYSKYLLNEAQQQLMKMKKDILKGIVQNGPFYGALSALLVIAFRSGPESWILTPRFTKDVLDFLKDAVEFVLSTLSTKTSNTAYSSSFAEMGLAIDEKIKASEIDDFDYNEFQLSPAHQVLISCIWTSLKVSCETACEIGILMQSDAEVRYCMDIIVKVLLKCRHKGVIESAGVAIANLSRHLYHSKEYCELPKTYLMSLLEEDTGKLLHLTRRGAGLSIMFHKLVVSDNRRDRPTVHFAIQMLLRSLENFSVETVRNVAFGQDSPWAKRLHFLRTLVADKEIHAQLLPYMEEICLICFKYMESDVWTVRNASLQLYGAVVPRLVGQCSGRNGKVPDFGDGYSINHFVTHYPKLANLMWSQLRAVSKLCEGTSSVSLRSYANVMPTLILLSKMWIGDCHFVDYPSTNFASMIRCTLRNFLMNPMMHIRQLAAKAYAALTPSMTVGSTIDSFRRECAFIVNNNMSQGLLLTIGYLIEKLTDDAKGLNTLSSIIKHDASNACTFDPCTIFLERYHQVLMAWQNMYEHKIFIQPCYVVEVFLFQELESVANETLPTDKLTFIDNLSIIEHIAASQKIQPGFFQFVELLARLYATHVKRTNDIDREVVVKILDSNCIEQSIGFLNGLSHCVPLLDFILRYLISIKDNCHQSLLDEIAAFILRTIKRVSLQTNEPGFDKIIEKFDEIETIVATNFNVIRMNNTIILAFSKCEKLINKVLSHVFDISMDDNQFARSMVVEYIETALSRFARLNSDNRLIIMRCCLILLKDEVTEIREIISTSLQKHMFRDSIDFASMPYQLQHEEIVYQRLLRDVIYCQFDIALIDDSIDFIRYFTRAIADVDHKTIIENPFYHNTTFYKEETKFLNLCFLYAKLKKDTDFVSNNGNSYETVFETTHAMRIRDKIQRKAGFDYNDLRIVLDSKEVYYLIEKRNIVIQQLN